MRRIAIIGAGGFARELRWLLSEIAADPDKRYEPFEVVCFLEKDAHRAASTEARVEEESEWLSKNHIDALAIGIGTPSIRLKVAERLKKQYPKIEWPAIIHPSVKYDQNSCKIGEGVILCAGVIATVNVVFEPFSMINLSCTIGHEARIGKGSALNPTVSISGGVRLGMGVMVGTGAQVLENIVVGDYATVGAGSVVTKNVESGVTVVGVPARPLVKNPRDI